MGTRYWNEARLNSNGMMASGCPLRLVIFQLYGKVGTEKTKSQGGIFMHMAAYSIRKVRLDFYRERSILSGNERKIIAIFCCFSANRKQKMRFLLGKYQA